MKVWSTLVGTGAVFISLAKWGVVFGNLCSLGPQFQCIQWGLSSPGSWCPGHSTDGQPSPGLWLGTRARHSLKPEARGCSVSQSACSWQAFSLFFQPRFKDYGITWTSCTARCCCFPSCSFMVLSPYIDPHLGLSFAWQLCYRLWEAG